MPKAKPHRWEFRARFHRNSFGWKSQPAMKWIKEAVSEIKKVARKDPALAAEGAILFLEKVSPALTHVDGSSGSIGASVENAIAVLVPLIAKAPADAATRDSWLDRLWHAFREDRIPYIESLGDQWGSLCASREVASHWADVLMKTYKLAWHADPDMRSDPNATVACLSCLLAAERHAELLEFVEKIPHVAWYYRSCGVKALVAQGKKAEAIRFAEASRNRGENSRVIARACEDVLLSSGLVDEAYRKYALEANEATTYQGWFRAIAKKYPDVPASTILDDLVAHTPGKEGKWFAAAKSAGLFDEAIALAKRSPCSPQTLTRAARDYAEKNPTFAVEAGIAALGWLVKGHGYEVTSRDVQGAFCQTMAAAENADRAGETLQRIRELVATETTKNRFVTKALSRQLCGS